MPQARLPDINAAFTKYRNLVWSKLEANHFTFCTAALYALNGLLPDKYRIRISTIEYNKITKPTINAVCKSCGTETELNKIKVIPVLLSSFERMMSPDNDVSIWFCPKCQRENEFNPGELTQTILQEPYFARVVSKPPERKDGIASRMAYNHKYIIWAVTLMSELEAQMAQFRDDNWQKGSDLLYDIDTDIDTNMEENE